MLRAALGAALYATAQCVAEQRIGEIDHEELKQDEREPISIRTTLEEFKWRMTEGELEDAKDDCRWHELHEGLALQQTCPFVGCKVFYGFVGDETRDKEEHGHAECTEEAQHSGFLQPEPRAQHNVGIDDQEHCKSSHGIDVSYARFHACSF